MKITIGIERIVSALIIALLFGTYMHHDYTKWNFFGRDAYLAHEATHFDHSIAQPHLGTPIFAAIIVFAAIFITYELLSAAFGKLFNNH